MCYKLIISIEEEISDYIGIYTDLKLYFENLQWFSEEGWRCSVVEGQQKCSFILDKPFWEQHQIYLVTWIGEHELKRNNIKIVVVVEEELSRRKEFVKSLEHNFHNVINDWGYAMRPKKRFILCRKFSPLDKKALLGILENEFIMLKQLGTIIDRTIEDIFM